MTTREPKKPKPAPKPRPNPNETVMERVLGNKERPKPPSSDKKEPRND